MLPCPVVKTDPPTELNIQDGLDEMSRETDRILTRSAKLIAELEGLLETGRPLRAAQKALLEEREKSKATLRPKPI